MLLGEVLVEPDRSDTKKRENNLEKTERDSGDNESPILLGTAKPGFGKSWIQKIMALRSCSVSHPRAMR